LSLSASLRKSLLALFGLQGALYLLPLVSLPYLTRVLGSENFGRVALAQAVAQYLVLLTDYGFNLSATRSAALVRDEQEPLAKLLTSVTILRTILCIGSGILMAAAVIALPSLAGDGWLYAFAFGMVIANVAMPSWFFQGLGLTHYAAGCTLIGQVFSLAALVLIVRGPQDYHLAAAAQAAGMMIAAALAWVVLWRLRAARMLWPASKHLRETLVEGWPFFLSSAAVHLYTTSNTVVLGLVSWPQSVGHFAAADRLMRGAQGLLAPVSQVFYPHIARLAAESEAHATEFICKLLRWQALATLLLSAAIFALAEPLILLLCGPQFLESVSVLRWLALLPFLVGLSNVLGIQTMLNFGMKRAFSRIIVLCGLVNLALLFAWAPRHGAGGAAAAVLITELLVVVLMASALFKADLLVRILRSRST
jgi:polysaccharide transporter, PST family